jgi:hypothetical protein
VRDDVKALLPCSVPDLEFNSLAVNLNSFDFEINANGGHKIVCENIILQSISVGLFLESFSHF